MTRLTIAVLAALVAVPAAAQEWQVAREQFTYAGTRLTIKVDVDAKGTLRLIRGAPGTVRVASRSQDGFTTSGLAEDDRLTLSAVGDGPVDFMVAVPENVFVNVRLPGKPLGENVARGRSGTWEWNAAERSAEPGTTRWMPGVDEQGLMDSPLYTTFSRDRAPIDVQVPDLSVIARVSVRFEGFRFKVIASRPLSVAEGSLDHLVIRPASPPMELVLSVPAFTRAFTLRLGGSTALVVDGGSVATLCTPVTEQRLSDGRWWFTFNPLDNALDCGTEAVQRHGG